MRAVFPHATDPADADYNIVQNNGEGADQVVQHLHFHIVPRPEVRYPLWDEEGERRRYSRRPTGAMGLESMFGRGGRVVLEEGEGRALVAVVRGFVREEWAGEFGEWEEGGDGDGEEGTKGGRTRQTRVVVSRREKERQQLARRKWLPGRGGLAHLPRS